MNASTHTELANFIWSICNLLRGPYKRNEYRKVILPLTVLRRFDCLLAPTKARVLAEHPKIKAKPETVSAACWRRSPAGPSTTSPSSTCRKLLDDPNQLAPNLNAYINGFSKNVREIMERFALRPADRAHGREEPPLRGHQEVRRDRPVARSASTTSRWATSSRS